MFQEERGESERVTGMKIPPIQYINVWNWQIIFNGAKEIVRQEDSRESCRHRMSRLVKFPQEMRLRWRQRQSGLLLPEDRRTRTTWHSTDAQPHLPGWGWARLLSEKEANTVAVCHPLTSASCARVVQGTGLYRWMRELWSLPGRVSLLAVTFGGFSLM